MAYPNWKLGEKKAIKEALESYEEGVKTIKEKLGSHWEVDIDWGTFGELIDANSSYRSDPGKTVIGELFTKFIENDLNKMGDDSIAALNGIVGNPAKLFFTMGKKTEKYELNSRCSIKLDKGQATLKWSNDWTGYAWGDAYLERTVINKPNVAVKPDYPGGWNIAQLRTIAEVKEELENADKEIKGKLGADWKLNVAWESFAKNIPETSSYRENIGKTVVQNLVTKFVDNDLAKMDEDVTGAANELAGSKHVITFRMGPKTGSYKINSRLNVALDDQNGAVLEWSGDWAGYEFGGDYLNQYVLSNA